MDSSALYALLLIMTTDLPVDSAGSAYSAPPRFVVEGLRRVHDTHDWLIVSTDSARFETRVAAIDAFGLRDLSGRPSAAAVPGAIAWSSIARIDRRESNVVGGRITGALLGGLVGAAAGGWLGSQTMGRGDDFQADVFGACVGGVLVGGLGAWWGGRVGDRTVHLRPVYLGERPSAASTTASGPDASRDIERLRPGDLLRIRGDFGEFTGYATRLSNEGLAGWCPEPSARQSSTFPAILAWERIDRIDRREKHGIRGATAGALIAGAALGAAGALLLSQSYDDPGAGILGLSLAGGACGLIVVGLVSAVTPGWHRVYSKRSAQKFPDTGPQPGSAPRPNGRPPGSR